MYPGYKITSEIRTTRELSTRIQWSLVTIVSGYSPDTMVRRVPGCTRRSRMTPGDGLLDGILTVPSPFHF